jgi:pimeloyl-ACP methyl ester carboxylesterase
VTYLTPGGSRFSPIYLAVLGLGALGCSGSSDTPETPAAAAELKDIYDCEVVVPDSECDTTKRPIVFIHGTFGSATEISNPAQLFGSNGYCQDRFVAVEYDSLGQSPVGQLEALVDDVLAKTGFDKVDLAGHSQGTGHACTYLSTHSDKVAHYLNLSGGCNGNGVPTLALTSQNDLGRAGADGTRVPGPVFPAATPNQTQVALEMEDHVAVAGSKKAFIEMWKFLYGEEPQYTTVQCGQDPVVLDGKAVTLGDNIIRANAKIEVFEVDRVEEPWVRGKPYKTIQADENGHFHAELRRGIRYELRQWDADGTLLGYVYYAPFKRSNYLARLLSESQNALVKSATTDAIVRAPGHSVWVARYLGGVLRADWGNSLKIDGAEVLTSDNAGKSSNVTGLFMFDANENKKSDLGKVYNVSFLWGTDVYIDSSKPRWLDVEWKNEEGNTASLKVPNFDSGPPASGNELDRSLPALYLPHY